MTGDQPGNDHDEASRTERRRGGHVERVARPRMRDLSGMPQSSWRAVAEAEVGVSQETLSDIVDGRSPRGDVLTVAELAGVMAAKRTAELIPLRHSVPLTELLVQAVPDRAAGAVRIRVETAAVGQSGVEMEALTAAAIGGLALYDMIREEDPNASIRAVRLLSRSGGDGGAWERTFERAYDRGHAPRGARVAGRLARPLRPAGDARGIGKRNLR